MLSPRRLPFIALVASALLLAACTSASPSAEEEGTTVNVTLQEWAVVLPDVDSAPAGEITFHVTNEGPADEHELVVIKTDLDPGDLPTDETGKADEEGEGIVEVMGEVELAVDATDDLTLDLEAGNYVLLCNIYSEEEDEAHYAEGMRIGFTVE